MSEKVPGLLEKLSLSHWYKYILYISGILLVLTAVFGSKIPQESLISFCLWSIGLSLFVWILDDLFNVAGNYYLEKERSSYGIPDEVTVILWGKHIVNVLFFFFWVIVTVASF